MDLMITAHLKQGYENWKELFDSDGSARTGCCDESKTMVAKVDGVTALIVLFGVDQEKMNARLSSKEFTELVDAYVRGHDLDTLDNVNLD
jgi:hypothetical protein